MNRFSKLLIAALFVPAALCADPFNKNLSAKNKAVLESGEVLIKNLGSMDDVCVNKTEQTKQILSVMKKLDPAYSAEVIQIRPYEGNEDLLDKLNTALTNLDGYVGIPYYSERTKKWYKLYSSAETTKVTVNDNVTTIDCILEMSLFGKFKSRIEITQGPDYYFYTCRNMEKLVYHEKFTAIKSEKMVSSISAFRDGDNWVLYAIGGAAIPKVFFLEDRIETSLINRIKTFCNYVFTKISEPEAKTEVTAD